GFKVAQRIRQQSPRAVPIVFLLSTTDFRSDLERVRELGGAGYLTKPFKESDLWRALAGIFDPRVSESGASALADSFPELHQPESHGRLRILLVDDNTFNQKVGVQKLEKLGHNVRVASSGREALAATAESRFDLIFMDLTMADMDGLEATAAI